MEKQELEQQRLGENKETKINKTYIESGEYRRKFDGITDDSELNRLLYNLAKKMLFHRSGTLFEDMYWIDADTNEVFARMVDSKKEKCIQYSHSIKERILQHKRIITIHSHPDSYPPSAEDFNANFERGYEQGIIICHNGDVYTYSSYETVNVSYFDTLVENYVKSGYNEKEAQILAIKRVSANCHIKCKEVVI